MDNFNLTAFIANLDADLSQASNMLGSKSMFYQTFDGGDREPSEEIDEQLGPQVEMLHLKTVFGLEAMKLQWLLENYLKEASALGDDFSRTDFDARYDMYESPFCELIRKYLKVLQSQAVVPVNQVGLNLLESMLRNTALFLREMDITPQSESMLQKRMYPLIKSAFPSAFREVVINQVDRNYKADFGIKSLESLIEFKFVTSLSQYKKTFGQIYEDMGAYSGSSEWSRYYAVIYMTGPFATQESLVQDQKRAWWHPAWIPILITGHGGRRSKKPVSPNFDASQP